LNKLTIIALKAKALKTEFPNLEIVQADFDDPQSVVRAMKDAYGVFGVTDFREHGYEESRHGKTLVDAAKAAGVKHFVWSTFDHTETGTKVPHFESKWEVNGRPTRTLSTLTLAEHLKQSGMPRTSLYTAMYYENLRDLWRPQKTAEGAYIIPIAILPDGKRQVKLLLTKSQNVHVSCR
jgi:NmrA-like family